MVIILFFFQAEDGIRDLTVTGVQTCALPISKVASQANCQANEPSSKEPRWVNVVATPMAGTPLATIVCLLSPQTRTTRDRKSTRLNSSHSQISYAVFCLKKKRK